MSLRLDNVLHDGMVLRTLPFSREHIRHDLKKAPGMKWHIDEWPVEGRTELGYTLTLRAQDRTLSLRWIGERSVYTKTLLKKTMLMWYWQKRGQWQEKDPGTRLPFPYERQSGLPGAPIMLDQTSRAA